MENFLSKSLITDSYLSELGLDKQTYTQSKLNENLKLISKHPECIIEKYDTVIDIADYIYEDYINDGQDGFFFVSFIYNNINVYIQNDSEISHPSIQCKYIKSQIDICDLDKIKKTFKFLSSAF